VLPVTHFAHGVLRRYPLVGGIDLAGSV